MVGVRQVGVRQVGVRAIVVLQAALLVLAAGAAPARAGAPLRAASAPPGAWGWPLPGRPQVLQPFAPGPTRYSPGHYGADLAGAAGTPVLAAGAGRVSFAGLVAGRGVVVLEHPGTGLRTSYEPVDALVVLGAEVERGEVLGLLEPFGHACPTAAACLHWGLRRGRDDAAAYLDPLRLLVRPVRLLPHSAAPAHLPAAPVSHLLAAPVRRTAAGEDAGPTAQRGPSTRDPVPAAVRGAVSLLLPVAALLLQG